MPESIATLFTPQGAQGSQSAFSHSSPRNPSRILEIVCTAEYVFALSSGGQCAAFMRRDLSPVSTLNDGEHEFIQTVYYNRRADALVIVSVLSTDKTHRPHCWEIPVRCVGGGTPVKKGGAF